MPRQATPRKKAPAKSKAVARASAAKAKTRARTPTKEPEFFNGWKPRPHQASKFQAFDEGIRYHFYVWHRRAGKDSFALNLASKQLRLEVGTYWHLFPLHVQARRAIWKGMDKDGLKFMDQAFPQDIRAKTHETDMMIEFMNGSTWQLAGSDYYDRLVGANVRGVVFSEWALCDPRAWTYVAPIIRENGGWAMFITTFRGRNHAYQMFERIKNNPEWCAEKLDINDTGLLTSADMDAERANGVSEAMIQQEYFCNPLAASDGAIYGAAMEKAIHNRSGDVPYDPAKPVQAAWSLKHYPVNISVIFAQGENIIGSSSYMFEDFATVLSEVSHSVPWTIANHILLSDSVSDANIDIFRNSGIFPRIITESRKQTIIANTASFIGRAHFDTLARYYEKEGNNVLLIDSLNGYSAKETSFNAWSLTGVTEHEYLAHALETYAQWYKITGGQTDAWGKAPSYHLQDRAVI